jgi:cytochrome b561
MLTSRNPALVKVLDGWHQNFMWALLVVAGMHDAAAFVHLFYYRDDVMRRMLPGGTATEAFAGEPVQSSSERS